MQLPVVIARLFNTVGPRQTGQYGMVVPRFVQQVFRGEPLTVYGDGSQSRSFCDVDDVVRAIIALIESPTSVGQVFNIGSTDEITILDLAHRIQALANERNLTRRRAPGRIDAPDSPIRFIPYDKVYSGGFEDMQRRVPDTTRIRATIGWEPQQSLDATLRRVLAYHDSTEAAPPVERAVGCPRDALQ